MGVDVVEVGVDVVKDDVRAGDGEVVVEVEGEAVVGVEAGVVDVEDEDDDVVGVVEGEGVALVEPDGVDVEGDGAGDDVIVEVEDGAVGGVGALVVDVEDDGAGDDVVVEAEDEAVGGVEAVVVDVEDDGDGVVGVVEGEGVGLAEPDTVDVEDDGAGDDVVVGVEGEDVDVEAEAGDEGPRKIEVTRSLSVDGFALSDALVGRDDVVAAAGAGPVAFGDVVTAAAVGRWRGDADGEPRPGFVRVSAPVLGCSSASFMDVESGEPSWTCIATSGVLAGCLDAPTVALRRYAPRSISG
jgi:hypothetical protein